MGVALVTFGGCVFAKGGVNFYVAESGDSDQHPSAGHTRKSSGGRTAEFLPSLREATCREQEEAATNALGVSTAGLGECS